MPIDATQNLKITQITTRILQVPLARPVASSNIRLDAIWLLLLDLDTQQGVRGSSYIWAFNSAGAKALKAVIEHLSGVVIGEDPCATTRLWSIMWRAIIQWGHAGIAVMGLSALDAAVWDILGKVAGQPIANLLGRKVERVPVYASGLWVTDDLDGLVREARGYIDLGFRGMKMRIGRKDYRDDVAAVRAVREAIGSNVHLMVDFGSTLSYADATKLAHALEPFELFWIEDPVADEDVTDHARITAEILTPICFGEKVYTPHGFQQAIDARAADILMADMQRAAGVTGWNRIAGLAAAARLPLSSHLLPELNLHLVASAPTGLYLEYMIPSWGGSLFNEEMEIVDGTAVVPRRPGFGLTWHEDTIRTSVLDTERFCR